jgi:hypothetical protein
MSHYTGATVDRLFYIGSWQLKKISLWLAVITSGIWKKYVMIRSWVLSGDSIAMSVTGIVQIRAIAGMSGYGALP